MLFILLLANTILILLMFRTHLVFQYRRFVLELVSYYAKNCNDADWMRFFKWFEKTDSNKMVWEFWKEPHEFYNLDELHRLARK